MPRNSKTPAPGLPLRLMLVGATGAVGSQVLEQALRHPGIAEVVALTRRRLPAHPKLANQVVDFSNLPANAPWWAVNAVVCALGTTLRVAGSPEAFVTVDRDWPIQVARLARAAGASRFALNSSLGANALSKGLYLRTKGETEDAIGQLGFPSYTIVRPSLIDAQRQQSRPAEALGLVVARALRPLIPRRYRAVTPDAIAHALLGAVLAGQPGLQVRESETLQRPA